MSLSLKAFVFSLCTCMLASMQMQAKLITWLVKKHNKYDLRVLCLRTSYVGMLKPNKWGYLTLYLKRGCLKIQISKVI